ncbi:MAG: OmpH family outer membrane protein [Bacteroidetes bacterium]|nr:OmpH family outer membrane protein [Bacteroidota bacterium]
MKAPKIFLTLAIALMCNLSSFAQTQKIGHVNSSDIIMAMPEKDTIQQKLKDFVDFFQNELKEKNAEYEKKVSEYQLALNGPNKMSETIRQIKENDIIALRDQMSGIQEGMQAQYQQEEQKLLEPVQKRVQDAIEKVAKAHKYSYVFDMSTGAALYSDKAYDITELVKKELGIATTPAATTTGATTKP